MIRAVTEKSLGCSGNTFQFILMGGFRGDFLERMPPSEGLKRT